MKEAYIEKIYAGWLAKIIGIRLGAPIEGWTYEKIKNIYEELDHYPVDYHEFAADDDSNGPLFFLKAMENKKDKSELKAQDVAEALLNYAPYEHGFFWWGGYGVSTEHTAYLNLRSGIKAPRSGSIEQNGAAIAEQIGGQIFIDTWGLVTAGNPDLAAKYAKEAASVTHDGNGVYGGIFIAACISYAFVEQDIRKIIEKGLTYIPEDCEYTRVVKAVIQYHENNPENWRICFRYIFDHFGYDKYPGNCHIIPNIAVMILGLLYGEGDFSKTITITNMCGWDTDCNVGNVATIMGVRCGLTGIDYDNWRKPINDFVACSSVVGSLNIMDIPFGASYIAKLAYEIAGEEIPEPFKTVFEKRLDSCHFEYPGSTHAIRVRTVKDSKNDNQTLEYELKNSMETAYTGNHSLKIMAKPAVPGDKIYVYKKVYYVPEDFHDSRYDPCFSPLVYPGQTIHGSAYLPAYGKECKVRLYAREKRSNEILTGEPVSLKKGEWEELVFQIPKSHGGLIDEIGFEFSLCGCNGERTELTVFIDDLYADGAADYILDFSKEEEEKWNGLHREISQMTRLKGLMYLQNKSLHLTCSDFAEAYTGGYNWKDYQAEYYFTPLLGEHHGMNFRVQGAIRSYAIALLPDHKAALLKNDNGYITLTESNFYWNLGEEYKVLVSVSGNHIKAVINDTLTLEYTDKDYPYLEGFIGVSVMNGSHCSYQKIKVYS
ncbi:ADP-ribosylglycohydrolase family protein [Anaerocolumna sedimenticola]|uniref:ADP-ribosylglycohydrolase family protein n=1 Tax=Anaerocolumna sedimenticola TaxID=2696063 RepID=A0A6P1TLN1_9FIRM|nr:ADP-ribosylglycohydrolase family protein [Anaerocolumna sedimenticola]QHQ60921.1 ADP-ribosylglycohydrolase family protein [Anaerocolumna sedimenticola]